MSRSFAVLLSVFCLFFAGSLRAQYENISDLAASVYNRIGANNGRLQYVANKIEIRGKRLTALMGEAEALYSKLYNQLLLDHDILNDDGTVMDLEQLSKDESFFGNCLGVPDTLYHELAHAEWDVCIEEEESKEDEAFNDVIEDEVVPWLEDKETSIGCDKRLAMEWHGYFVGALIRKVLSDWADILYWNGIDPCTMELGSRQRSLVKSQLRKGLIAEEDFGKLLPELVTPLARRELFEKSYLDRVRGYSVYVKDGIGLFSTMKDADTSEWTSENGFKDEWWQAMWDHYDHFHTVPDSAGKLLERMSRCYEEELKDLAQLRWELVRELEAEAQEEDPAIGGFGDLNQSR